MPKRYWTPEEVIEAMRKGTPIPDDDIVNTKTRVDGEEGWSSMTVEFFKFVLMNQSPKGKA
jgi:hypothetical protein